MYNKTINYYNDFAKDYFDSTKNGDMSDIYSLFLKYLDKRASILDLGCGSGRDSKYFLERGYNVKAIDGSASLCKLASSYISKEVECKSFYDIDYLNAFDGVWACASLLHIPEKDFLKVLKKIILSLKEQGIFYISLKNGEGKEIDSKGRYYTYYTYEKLKEIFDSMNLSILDYKSTTSVTNPSEKKYWHNFILRQR